MTEPATTPFIPPLNTPVPSPGAGAQPPLVPHAPTGANPQYPSWAAQPQTAGGYPVYPNTPYTAGASTPFLPYTTPQAGMPQYFPGTGPPPPQMQLPPDMGHGHGHGYPPFGGATPGWPPAGAFPGTPWGAVPPGTPYSAHGAPSPYVPAGHPMAFAQQPVVPPQIRAAAWGGAGVGGPFTPAAAVDPWGAAAGAAPPPWAQAQMGMTGHGGGPMMHGMGMGMGMGMGGMGMGGMPGGMPGMMQGMGMNPGLGFGGFGGFAGSAGGAAGYGMAEQSRPQEASSDKINHFEAGPHYGPVLEPFLIRAVHAKVLLNPLIQPTDTETEAPFLKWSMLFPSNQCQRSDEPSHMSWSNGRQQPATFPRVTVLQLVSETFPWVIKVVARHRDIGVTCGEVIESISRDMCALSGRAEYEILSPAKQNAVRQAYQYNRSRAHGVPGGQLQQGMMRMDWLGQATSFGGVRDNERVVRTVCGDVLPCTFELVCQRRYSTPEDARNQEMLQRTLSERDARREARRQSSHRRAVRTVPEEEETTSTSGNEPEEDSSDEEQSSRGRRGRGRPAD